jgi:aspartyl-tRNA(Asn)/glutamyl-tRNA(Gln) amidotransferase subunit B
MYTVTVGLEVHAELHTATKMFCSCLNNSEEKEPNRNVCPVCLAHPGTLPVINKEAVRKVLMVGKAVGGEGADYTEFDRKNYFYPDIPKGYQISQYEFPLVRGGHLAGVALTRIHLEEDTARSQHESGRSLVDYNRAGVPLMELVTEPVIHTPEEAGKFARELQLLLRALGAGEANMEKGEMRVEANISVSKNKTLGTKVEVKNLNSFRSVERAIAYEVQRQTALLEKGEKVAQETRGWDEGKQSTFPQRKKESSHDYRYFPDPDLPALRVSEISEFKELALPELPWQQRERYVALGLKSDDADMFVSQPRYGRLFDESTKGLVFGDVRIALSANYIANDLAGAGVVVDAPRFSVLVSMIAEGKVSSRGGKDILSNMLTSEESPESIAKKHDLFQQSDEGAVTAVAQKVIDENPSVVADYKAGKSAALQFLLGQGMKLSKGSANPATLKDIFVKLLS